MKRMMMLVTFACFLGLLNGCASVEMFNFGRKGPEQEAGRYQVVAGSDFTVKMDTKTGESWWMHSNGRQWLKIAD